MPAKTRDSDETSVLGAMWPEIRLSRNESGGKGPSHDGRRGSVKAKRVRETFETDVIHRSTDYAVWVGLRDIVLEKFKIGDRVRVTVERLPRAKRRGKA